MTVFGLRSFVEFKAPDNSISLPLKDGSSEPFSKLIKDNVPELKDGTYSYMSPALFNGDLQTVCASAGGFGNANKVYYGRRIITFPEEDNAIISCDYLIPPPESKEKWKESLKYSPLEKPPPYPVRTRYLEPEEIKAYERTYTKEDKPLHVLLHGLSGGSHESYIRAIVDHISSGSEQPFDCVVLNSRGCGRTPITTPQLFCALWTDDVRRFIQILHKEQPGRRIYISGYSLGASILANYLGQQGDLAVSDPANKIDGAIIVAAPWDLELCNQLMHQSFMGNSIYSPTMADNLLILLKKHAHVLEENPAFNYDNRWKVDKLYDFDDVFTAPMFGFDSARDYYRHGSPVNRIMGIKVPTVIINALDDPIAHKACIPYIDASKNPYLLLTTTSLGGHLGWYQPHGKLWYPPVISKIFRALDKNVDLEKGVPNITIERPVRLFDTDRLVLPFHSKLAENTQA